MLTPSSIHVGSYQLPLADLLKAIGTGKKISQQPYMVLSGHPLRWHKFDPAQHTGHAGPALHLKTQADAAAKLQAEYHAAHATPFHTFSIEEQHAQIDAAANATQALKSASAAVSGFKASVLANKVPTLSQAKAFDALPSPKQMDMGVAMAAANPNAPKLIGAAWQLLQGDEPSDIPPVVVPVPLPPPQPEPLVAPQGDAVAPATQPVPVSGWLKSVQSGKKPLPAQMKAFAELPKDTQETLINAVPAGMLAHATAMGDASLAYHAKASVAKTERVAAAAGIQSMDAWSQVGPQAGSNPGGLFAAPGGSQWYCKFPQSADHAKNEVLAAKLYQAAGVLVPDLKLITQGGKIGVASQIVPGLTKGSPSELAGAEGAHAGFAVDAWLANWDVVGLGHDNLLLQGGQAVRVDTGGALMYRAQGAPKGEAFGTSVPELATLLDPKKNAQSAGVFASMSKTDLWSSIAKVLHVTDAEIHALVGAYGPGTEADKQALATKLIQRKHYLAGFQTTLAVPGATAVQPQEGDTKPGADGSTLVLKDGRWHAQAPAIVAAKQVLAQSQSVAAPVAPTVKQQTKQHQYEHTSDGHNKFWYVSVQGSNLVTHYGAIGSKGQKTAKQFSSPGMATAAWVKLSQEKVAKGYKRVGQQPVHFDAPASAHVPPLPAPAQAPVPQPDAQAYSAVSLAISQAMLPAANTNAVAVNKKLAAISTALAGQDVKTLQAMSFGSNNYGVKAAKLAKQAIVALGGGGAQPAVVSAQEAPVVPTFVPKAAAAAPATAVKPKPDPTKLDVKAEAIPDAPDFTTMNGGKGLSSKTHVNQANTAVAQALHDYALKGNLSGLENYQYDALDKEGGHKLGKKPIESHPSNQVKSYWSELVASLQMIANPPEALREFTAVLGENIASLSAAFKNEKYGVTTAKAQANKKLAFWIALGKVASPAQLVASPMFAPLKFESTPAKKVVVTAAQNQKAQADYAKLKSGSLVKQFINGIQASGSYNNNFRDGKLKTISGADLVKMNLEAHAYAQEKPAGFELYKWTSLSHDMVQQLLSCPEGTVFQNPGSMCASTAPTATAGFGAHRIRIRYAPGAKGVDSYGSGNFAGEKEITTLPGARFVILSAAMVQCPVKGHKRLELDVMMLPPDETYIADLKARVALNKT